MLRQSTFPRGGEGLIGCVHFVISSASNAVVAITRIKPNEHVVISSVSREIPYNRNENKRTRITPNTRLQGFPAAPAKCLRRLAAEKSPTGETKPNVHDYHQTLASGGSPPRNPLREKRQQTYTTIPNTCPQGFPAAPAHSPAGAPCTRRVSDHNKNYLKKCRNRSIYV